MKTRGIKVQRVEEEAERDQKKKEKNSVWETKGTSKKH